MARIMSKKGVGDARSVTEHGGGEPVPVASDLRAGSRLAGYELEEVVGRGGMGVVYRARHVHLQRTVALKLLGSELTANDFRERFVREARLAASIHHPNIVTVYDAGEADGLLYIAMQFVDGTDLAELIEREGPLEPEAALAMLGQIASALDAAHALEIVHRDVKPANVLLGDRPYLSDFGLTKRVSADTKLTRHGSFVGTVDYVAPEQIFSQPLDARADVYSLGCVLFHMLTGKPPFAKESELSVMYAQLEEQPPSCVAMQPGLPEELDMVFATALAKSREDRYESCGALIDAARAAVGIAPPASVTPVPASRPARRKVVIADDEPGVRALIRVGLGTKDFVYDHAETGDAALERVRLDEPALLFLDWDLPGRPAPELCGELRGSATKVVAVVSRRESLDPNAIRAAGASAVLRMPFSSLQLLSTVGELLGADAVAG
jgi:serine/threonine protein kinase